MSETTPLLDPALQAGNLALTVFRDVEMKGCCAEALRRQHERLGIFRLILATAQDCDNFALLHFT